MSEQKSGFEIRADLLNQAQGILQDNRSMKMDWYHNQVMRAQDNKDIAWPESTRSFSTYNTSRCYCCR